MENGKNITVFAPANGKVVPVDQVPDQVFSEKVLGDGIAIIPAEGKIYSPVNGEITTVAETLHAYGFATDDGLELLIHVGINTVELQGEGYEAFVEDGDRVKAGQKLIAFDRDLIASKGYPLITPVILTNADDFGEVVQAADGDVGFLDKLYDVKKD